MCGISGIVRFHDKDAKESDIRKMTDCMSHRGPDSDGFYVEEEVGLGHRRLSIIDLSTAANQPFKDVSGRFVMVFNGEIYNYQEVKRQLPDYPFHTTSDTETLLAAYIKWGAECLSRVRGMFALAIWDRQEKELFIARDRMGVKPLYYLLDEDKLIFSSEIRAIMRSEKIENKLNANALLEYFSYQSIGGPDSLIEGIHQLPSGSWMKIRNGQVERQVYWEPHAACAPSAYTDKTAIERRIRELLLQSVQRRLVSDVPVGAFLSGGIDSSIIVGLMAEAGNGRPNTFSIAFEEKEYDESDYADLIAKRFNSIHTNILLKPTSFLDELENALQAMDTPSGDGINTYVVSKAVRQKGMTVALSGTGGDELFAGYPFFDQFLQMQKRAWLWKLPVSLRRLATGLIPGTTGRNGRIKQLLRLPSPAIEHAYPVFRQMLSPDLITRLTHLHSEGGSATVLGRELQEKKHALSDLPLLSQITAAEYLGYTQHTLLKDMDQMSMAVSLELREPFFDQDLVEFVLGIPDRFKKPAYPKSLLVESVKPLLPEEVVFRRKQGFLFPWNSWLRQDLRSFCELRLKNMAQRDFVNGDALLAYWQRFLSGEKNIRWGEIWLFVVLECWLEKNC